MQFAQMVGRLARKKKKGGRRDNSDSATNITIPSDIVSTIITVMAGS